MARRSLFSRVTERVEAIVRAARGPETSRLAGINGKSGGYSTKPDSATETLLRSWGVLSSRVAPEAGPTKTRWALWPGDNLTPEAIISAQREAVTSGMPLRWVELIDQIYSRDGHYASCTTQRVADVVKGTWRLAPAAMDDAGIAACNITDEVFRSCSRWKDGLGWLLYSNLYSYNAVEVEWAELEITFQGPKGETIGPLTVAVPARLHNVHPKHFRFDLESDDPLFYIGNGYQPLPYGKFVFLDGEGLHPTKVRRGHAWQCVWYSLFRSMGWAAWGVHVDRFSLPVPIIEYDGGVAQYEEYKAAYLDILTRLGQGLGVVMPRDGGKFQIHNPPSGGTANDPASALSDACDAGQSIRVLGGQLNNKIGNVGSFSASSNHLDIKYGLEELDADRAWERIDEQLTGPFLRFNAEAIARALNDKGYNVTPSQIMRRIPKGKHHIPGKTDPHIEMQIMDLAVNKLGLPLSVAGAFARMDFQRARDDGDRIKGEATAIAKGGALVTASEAAEDGGIVNEDPAAEATAKAAASAPPAPPAAKTDDRANRMERAAETLANLARGGALVHPREVLQVFDLGSVGVKMEGEE